MSNQSESNDLTDEQKVEALVQFAIQQLPPLSPEHLAEIREEVLLQSFAISVAVLCYISYKLAKISFVSETLEKYERILVPIVFIGLGIYILIENGTIQTLLNFI